MNALSFFKDWREQILDDQVKLCAVYKALGCAPADDILCDIKTCGVSVTLVSTPKSVEEVKRQGLYERREK